MENRNKAVKYLILFLIFALFIQSTALSVFAEGEDAITASDSYGISDDASYSSGVAEAVSEAANQTSNTGERTAGIQFLEKVLNEI